MKDKIKVLGNLNRMRGSKAFILIILLTALLTLSAAACSGQNVGEDGKNINSAEALKAYLDSQPANSPDKPIIVKIIINASMLPKIVEVINSSGKYVSLDLSDSPMITIGRGAFAGCSNITSITIPNSVINIEDQSFAGCTSLATINVDTNNTNYSSEHGVLYNKNKTTLVAYPGGKTGAFTIPDNVTSIGEWAFSNCTNLTNITIPDNVTNIGEWAFGFCSGLTSVTIKNGVTRIEGWAFFGCSGLTNIIIPDSVTSIGDQAFRNCTSLASITIPDSVTSIGGAAFYDTTWFDNQPNGLVYAGKVAYEYKGDMPANTRITLLDGTKEITDAAFFNCTNLTSITIPNSVTNIGFVAFSGCSGLTNVTVPNSVTSIGEAAFQLCTRLTSVTFTTGSNIANSNFGDIAFPEGNNGYGGDTLKTAYRAGKAGTYTRAANGSTWTKQ